MNVNKQLDNPFDRAERIRLLEAEMSLNINAVNNVSTIMSDEDRLNDYSSIESTMESYMGELAKLRLELIERVDALEMTFIRLELENNEQTIKYAIFSR